MSGFNESLNALIALDTSISDEMVEAQSYLKAVLIYGSEKMVNSRNFTPINTAICKVPLRFRQSLLKGLAFIVGSIADRKEKIVQVEKNWTYSRKNGLRLEKIPGKKDFSSRLKEFKDMDLRHIQWLPREQKQVKINFQQVRDWLETASSDKVREAFPERYLQKLETAWQEVHNKTAKTTKTAKTAKNK